MRKSRIDLTGKRFYNLTVLEYTGSKTATDGSGRLRPYYKCQCDCGNIVEVCGKYLTCGHKKSCGCRKLKVASEQCKRIIHVEGTVPQLMKSDKARKDNVSTGIKNISYRPKSDLYDVNITYKGKKYRQYVKTLPEAIKVKIILKNKIQKSVNELLESIKKPC